MKNTFLKTPKKKREDHIFQDSLRSDCCKLIKNRWKKSWGPVRRAVIFGKIEKNRKRNPRNNEMISCNKFNCNQIVGSRLKLRQRILCVRSMGGGGNKFYEILKNSQIDTRLIMKTSNTSSFIAILLLLKFG